mmetsp:Transcript_25097/g.65564  ORF Transcript_25097/g.65564 Transcript_25097/m.65564 type:complete len:205 (+) Transcript_25097:887-1501(+)
MVLALEHRLAEQDLAEDAPDGPDVHGGGVLLRQQHDLGCAVPSCDHVLGEDALYLVGLVRLRVQLHVPARQAEIADLHLAVVRDQHVRGLQVTVSDASSVQVFQGPEDLRDDDLYVLVAQALVLGVDDLVQVRGHVGQHQVDVLEVRRGHRGEVQQVQQVLVPQARQEPDLPQHDLALGRGVPHVLHGHFVATALVRAQVDVAV